jgi:hypothetical protein
MAPAKFVYSVAFSRQLSAFSRQLSAFSRQLSAFNEYADPMLHNVG